MPTSDTSAWTRTLHKQSRVLQSFKLVNPVVPEQGPHQGTDESTRVERKLGNLQFVSRVPGGGTFQEPPVAGDPPTGVTNLEVNWYDNNGSNELFHVTWTPDPLATSYTVSSSYQYTTVSGITNQSAELDLSGAGGEPFVVTVTAINAAGQASVSATGQACFLAGTPVHMSDGTTKAIEEVLVGDIVVGAFGEANPVIALQRVFLGNGKMYKINGEHDTTDHHPHISADRTFYTPEPSVIDGEVYGKTFPVIGPAGPVMRRLHGLTKGRVQKMELGVELKTIDGKRVVQSMESYSLPFQTPLYNLVVGGSHTYHANGYAVTGWPREDDFDYEAWIPRV
jgi:hypothetical protein